jgi:hypothetical protein
MMPTAYDLDIFPESDFAPSLRLLVSCAPSSDGTIASARLSIAVWFEDKSRDLFLFLRPAVKILMINWASQVVNVG